MSEDKDKQNMWKVLKDPVFGIMLPVYDETNKQIAKVQQEQKDNLTAEFKKLNSKLGWIDEE